MSTATAHNWYPSAADAAHDRVDVEASLIASQAVAGVITEQEARWEIAALVTMSDIPEAVAQRYCDNAWHQEKVDTSQFLREMLETKIVGPNPSLDLAVVAGGSSVSGWARMLASSQQAITSARRSVGHGRSSGQIPTDPHSYQHPDAIASLDGSEYTGSDGDENMLSEVWDALAANYIEKSNNMRPNGAVHQIAETLCDIYQLPIPARAINMPNRKQMIASVQAEQHSVRDDLRASAASRWSNYVGLAVLFSDWSLEDVNRLAIQHPLVSQAIALSALTPLPPARKAEIKALGESLMDPLGKLTANRVAKAWAAVYAELNGSEYDNTKPSPKMKTKAQRDNARRIWETEVSALVEKGITLLGTTPEEVTSSLGLALDAIRHTGHTQAA